MSQNQSPLAKSRYRLQKGPAPSLAEFASVSEHVPQGVICLLSALAFHELTLTIPPFLFLAIPSRTPITSLPPSLPLRPVAFPKKMLQTGVEEHVIGSSLVKIFNAEKTIIDCVVFQRTVGKPILLEALNMYWSRGLTKIDLLFEYATLFKAQEKLQPLMETIINAYQGNLR